MLSARATLHQEARRLQVKIRGDLKPFGIQFRRHQAAVAELTRGQKHEVRLRIPLGGNYRSLSNQNGLKSGVLIVV